ncbi:MAG: hypothetical protein AB1716_12690, partial [Planctomycetota bacterium]
TPFLAPDGRTPGLARPVAAADFESAAPATFTARRMRGTTGSLVCGILAVLALVGMGAAAVAFKARFKLPLPGEPPPKLSPEMAALSLTTAAGALALLVFSITAIALGVRALRRMRWEPGVWTGRWRARVGIGLGVLAAGIPLVGVVISIVRSLSQ